MCASVINKNSHEMVPAKLISVQNKYRLCPSNVMCVCTREEKKKNSFAFDVRKFSHNVCSQQIVRIRHFVDSQQPESVDQLCHRFIYKCISISSGRTHYPVPTAAAAVCCETSYPIHRLRCIPTIHLCRLKCTTYICTYVTPLAASDKLFMN